MHTENLKYKDKIKAIFFFDPGHDPVIDTVRALSVLSIVAFHLMAVFLKAWGPEVCEKFFSSASLLFAPILHAEKGVDAFFLISGLVLGLPIYKKLDEFDWKMSKSFYQRRFFRIYPLFFLALVIYTLTQGANFFNLEFFANAFFINNLFEQFRPIIPVGWSLTIEVQMYLFLPLLFFLQSRVRHPQFYFLLLVLISFVLSAAALIRYPEIYTTKITDLVTSPDRDAFGALFGSHFYETLHTRFAPLVIGLWLAFIKINHDEQLRIFLNNRFTEVLTFLLGGLLVMSTVMMPTHFHSSWYHQPFDPELNFLYLVFSRPLFSLGIALIMITAWYGTTIGAVLKNFSSMNFWCVFSKLAFPIYLFHFPFVLVAAVLVFHSVDPKVLLDVNAFQVIAVFVFTCILTILFSIPLHIYIEKKFIAYGRTQSSL